MPTVLDVAKRAGVAPITVSRVINNSGYISQATRERVEAAVKELGYVRIAVITGSRDVSTSVDRVAGYRRALMEAGLIKNELIYYGGFNQQSGYEFTQQAMMHSPKPTAIFGANNFIAIGIIKALRDLKVNIPGDVSVGAFDDFPESMLVASFLTFVEQPAYEMGRVATELLLKRISGELADGYQQFVLPTKIIECGSTGPNNSS